MGRPVIHFEVVGKDGKALGAFYSELFEWTVDTDNPMNYGTVERYTRADGTGIGGGVGQGPEGYEGHVTFYVEVPDVDAALKKAESLGAKTVMPRETIMEGVTIGQFVDPQGNMIGLLEEVS